ncbi:replication-relaxation family protein [Amycolatopsis albispora]|uniref:replication-relaxation family protein n=1 Tax=Amycolatopsis albispora TaxID=1804986 RepID=UPI003003A64C
MLFEHHVLTSTQIVDIAFPSRRAANLRLRDLYQWGVLHRFQPHRTRGSHPMHYVLDTAGAVALAHETGLPPRNSATTANARSDAPTRCSSATPSAATACSPT